MIFMASNKNLYSMQAIPCSVENEYWMLANNSSRLVHERAYV